LKILNLIRKKLVKIMAQQEEGIVMSFWGHLEELRSHLIRASIAIVLFALGAFVGKDFVFSRIILAPREPMFFTNRMFCSLGELLSVPALCININPLPLQNVDMAGQFTTHVIVSLIAGIIVSAPYIIWELWRFIKPGLQPDERANSRGAVLITSGLFITGILFAYYLILPLTINFLGNYQVSEAVNNHVTLRSYITTVTTLTLAVGIVFELPILIYFLSRIGIMTPVFMRKNRRTAFIIILALSALITPPDVFSQIMVGLPLYLLYEISIGISARVVQAREKALA
jgi:sec-independent protein translocase protein TatC